MGDWFLWPWIALGAFCFGVSSGIAWAAMYRPTMISISLRHVVDQTDD